MEQKTWLSYWKKCLSDALSVDIDIDKLHHFELENYDSQAREIEDLVQVNQLIDIEEIRVNKKKGIELRENENWINIDSIQVMISPFKLIPLPERLLVMRDQKTKFPFWFYAKLNRKGQLSVPEELFPVFQRKYLEPLADEKTEFIFSTVAKIDEVSSLGKEEYKSLEEYLQFVQEVFSSAIGQSISEYETEGYATIHNAIILLPDEEINAAYAIVQLYEKILKGKDIPALLSKLITLENRTELSAVQVDDLIGPNPLHLGQMGYAYPLSISQRKCLYTFLQSKDKVFAVNGPPGTGKTTLLQSIVANMVVEAALDGNQPPLILACSTNNQAVTNIIDSFSRSTTMEGPLQGRWIPEMEGYATYLPANGKSAEELKGINYKKLSGVGIFSKLETYEYLQEAGPFFVEKGNAFFASQLMDTQAIILLLQKEIKHIQETLLLGSEYWKLYLKSQELFNRSYRNENTGTDRYFTDGMLSETAFELDLANLSLLEKNVIEYFRTEPFFRKLCCFLNFKFAWRNRATELRILLRDSLIATDEGFEFTRNAILDKIDRKITEAKQIIKAIREWKSWKIRNNITGNPPPNEEAYWDKEYSKITGQRNNDPKRAAPNCFYDELDVGLRHKAFQLALHYWEGRWLLKLEEDLASNNFTGRNDEKSRNRWLRQAMLTPCFVSTFYMAPKFFSSARFLQNTDKGDPIFDNPPLYEFIDLLIVDEAGQVSPEVGIPTFSMAKRAVVVGDVKQIEPVYNITNKMDIGNLKQGGLIKNYDHTIFETEYSPKGFLASSGSIMKMAQNSCNYREKELPERGLMLVEHRRCYDEIINYCNVLAYGGLLKPLKGKGAGITLFPSMSCIHVEGGSVEANKTRHNQQETDAIVKWLVANRDKIEHKYQKKIEQVVGIITPFVGQKNNLRSALKRNGFDLASMKLGTVHALQGAERPIIILSMVYGDGEVGTMFFDRDNKPNMLNVAVSRAQDSFIVFANTRILDKNARTPSGILANHLTYQLA
ncbi:AAA family ATPase [Pseudoflavitalea sp. G-6-1-2]|uniref:AAA domain-containing protein n=1 Tax=Pseudoflavitalea sp. G-6-1-2 TaxID=2728841 RepID=UPI00146DCCAB|nr:AAA domain-containing protein [Pseudoflavitalea sp. G-6-1-2]NML21385.1 AAA family ATPase [Pseudoflavitalea sp. G-6-1-2]